RRSADRGGDPDRDRLAARRLRAPRAGAVESGAHPLHVTAPRTDRGHFRPGALHRIGRHTPDTASPQLGAVAGRTTNRYREEPARNRTVGSPPPAAEMGTLQWSRVVMR